MTDNVIIFIACPNHNTNVGWNKLRFVSKDKIKCDLCGREFTVEQVKNEIGKNYYHDLQNLQHAYVQNLAALQYMGKHFEGNETTKIEQD